MRTFLIAAIAALAVAPTAEAFLAQNGMRIEPTEAGSFAVPQSRHSGVTAFWCAAGDYAIRGLSLDPGTRIYRYSAPPRRSGEGILFGFDPALAQSPGLLRIQGGRGVIAAHARAMCQRFER